MDYAPPRGWYSAREDALSQCNQGSGKRAISCQQILRQNLDWLPANTCYLACPSHCQYSCFEGAIPNFACIFRAKVFCKVGGNTPGNIHMARFYSDCAWHNCLLRFKRLDFDEPRDCTPLCLYHLVFLWHASTIQIRWQYVTIVTIGLWLLASQQSCQGQFIQQHWLIWQEAAYLSLEPGTD